MQRKKQALVAIAIAMGPLGSALGRAHLIGPNPGTFFALGALATLTVGGIVYGFKEGFRVAREGRPISN